MKTFYDRFFAFPVAARERIARLAGMSLPYILKHVYTHPDRNPSFRVHNAVALDEASNGALPFWEHSEGDIDWKYVLTRLQAASRQGKLSVRRRNTRSVDSNT